ncbi:response regulator [Paenibacillus pini]|uniref:Helix-turn-helix n=1 Tax=Paenibacillus pini JCM 16418 TaxID=1236976 RepID=W7YQL2_9BACL|nr:response regulator [Paenibacillus pini]GAF06896.1 helix-turn-helix [Paenibacillus pini JCM 16418]
MYKVIIVDDEAVVRDGLKRTIDWNAHGFELIGDYANGREAWEAIELTLPDLVISDISMPFMDGLELAGAVADAYPYIKMIILTGFDEFEYAQQAIRLKVSDFVLKPITAHEIRDLLLKVKQEMDEETQSHEDLSRLYNQLKQSMPLLKERFLERLVVNGIRNSEMEERFAYFGIRPLTPPYLIMVADIDDFGIRQIRDNGHDTEILRYAAFNLLEEISLRENLMLFRTREERMVLIVTGESEESALYERAFRIAEEARHFIEKYLKFTVTIGVGQTCEMPEQLTLSYKSAISALDYRFLLGKNRVLSILDMEARPSFPDQPRADWDRKLASAVKTGSLQDIHQLIRELVIDLKKSLVPMDACLLQIQKVLLSLLNTIQELGLQDYRPILLTDVYRFKTLDEIEVWLIDTLTAVMTAIADNRNHFTLTQVRKAVDYIETNYADEKMSLQDICRHVLMSTSYFSLVFKQHTSETFVEYLTRTRMEKAKEMLQHTSLKFYEIAAKVGYGDPNYFSILFKKHAGITPREFRDNHAKESSQ